MIAVIIHACGETHEGRWPIDSSFDTRGWAVSSSRSFCNRCQNGTNHDTVAGFSQERHEGDPKLPRVIREEWVLLRCCGCDSIKACLTETSPDYKGHRHTEYPPRASRAQPEWALQLPQSFQALVAEIYTALNAECRSLAAMGARTLVDLMLTDMLGDIGGFEAKLKQAVATGLLADGQRQTISAAVEAGHAVSHRGFVPSVAQLFDVLEIVEHALRDRYIVAETSRRLGKSVPPRGNT
jgi:hypothetical protein